MRLIEYIDRQQQAQMLARLVAGQLQAAIDHKGRACLAVPGGTTPAPFLQALAACTVDWAKVTMTLTDERQVPADHERSNAKLLRDNFLERVSGVGFLGLYGTPDTVTKSPLSPLLQKGEQGRFNLDTCILGMGTDGHFASLFPAVKHLEHGLDPDNPDVLMEITADNIPEPRISLTLQAILTAPAIHLLITGEEKQQVLTQAKQNADRAAQLVYPVEALIRHAGPRLSVHYAN